MDSSYLLSCYLLIAIAWIDVLNLLLTSIFSSTGFGTNTQTQNTSLFGSGTQNRTSGFGTTANTGQGLFGGTTPNTGATSGFGTGTGFGTTSTGTTGFGGSANTNTGLFGNKAGTGFGTSSTGTTGFGASGTTGFGAGATNTGFGGTGTAFQGAQTCEGTGGTPFNPFTEKDTNSSVTNHYQSISFMQPYSKFSFEELRFADYQQGRRFGNASGQPGGFGAPAFGSSTGFGGQQATTGFGASATPFGGAAATTAPTGFGTTQTTSAFGTNNTAANPLFGGAKPATSMFGGATQTPQTGSLFGGGGGGTTTNTTGGFGTSTTTPSTGFGTNTGTSLFGGNQQQNKPAFGASATGTGFGGGGFGATQTTTATNPFGSTTATASPFGAGQQQQAAAPAFGGFGSNQAQAQKPATGLFGGGGGFGTTNQQQQTGAGMFNNTAGQTTTGTSLFGGGQAQQAQAPGSMFGGGQAQQPAAGNSLFGGGAQAQQKPASSLFGGGATTTTGGAFGSSFGNTQAPSTTGGMFGGGQAQQAKPFGASTPSTGGLFGQTAAGQTGGTSLFGGNQSQQQQPAGNSIFGGSQPAQQQPQQPVPGSFQASFLDANPYGSQSIFSGLPSPIVSSPGPLATPLSSSIKQKQRTPLPVYKITPNAANRLITPPKRQGYGFSYSSYGSPSSTTSTPGSGLSSSLLGGSTGGSLRGSISGSLGRSFSKSYSTSNLRKSFIPDEDSVHSPGALLPTSARGTGGSLKRLTIDRSLRNDLFSRPSSTSPAPIANGDDLHSADKLKKKVSFDSTPSGSEVVRVDSTSPEPTAEELGFLRSTRKSGTIDGIDGDRPEMESVRRDLAVVPENAEPTHDGASIKRLSFIPGGDPKPGDYWMSPSHAELSKMSRDQLKKVVDFTVGRQNCGEVTFNGAVDLTVVDLDNLFGGIVDIGVRKITVYPDESVKPPMGKGLNVPSTLRIENSWPRGRDRKNPLPITSGPLFDKHVDRLRKVTDTEFVDYETDTGTWVFKVPHFTTYGLDYDEEEGESLEQSTLGAGPDDNRTPKAHDEHPASFEQSATFSIDESFVGSMAGVDDDTFDFKKRKIVPGSFGSQAMQAEDEDMGSEVDTESFLEGGSAGSTTEHEDDFVTESQRSGDSIVGSDEDQAMDMAGSFPNSHRTVEHDDAQSIDSDLDTTHPIPRPFGTPGKPRLDLSGDWAEQLQRTISPRKQNRDALREIQANAFTDRPLLNNGSPAEKTTVSPKKGFSTSIDLMNSLFQQSPRKQGAPVTQKASKSQPKGFEVRAPSLLYT
jgi:nuclear pore complex protein Nup98-Nup96